MADGVLKKYLFRERLIRAILKEWSIKKENISLRSIYYKYNLPYFKSRNFLIRLAKDGIITWRKDPYRKKNPSEFSLTPNSKKKLQEELLYASSV